MPAYRVLKRSTRERMYTDKIDPREHLHITGVEFTSSMIADIERANGSNVFKKQEVEEVKVEELSEKEEEEVKPKKGRTSKK